MRKDAILNKEIYSSFFSCEVDAQTIIRKLFVESNPYSDRLKRLLIINKPDCLDETNQDYKKLIDSKPLSVLRSQGYIRTNPKIARAQFEEIKSYILITFDNFLPNRVDPKYLDCTIHFDIICYDDEWDLNNFKERPIMIAGYIDGILNALTDENKAAIMGKKALGNNIKLSGMGEYKFLSGRIVILNQDISMYTISYRGVHLTEDKELLEQEDE